jgi:ComF family protein
VCGEPLQEFSRIPVCSKYLTEPVPLIAEYFCVACRMPFVNRFPLDETGRCALCRLGLRGFDAVYSYGSYEGALRQLVHLFKYAGVRPLAGTFGRFLAQALPRETTFDVIVPMPLHWFKKWQRGFNQSDDLAREVGKKWNVPVRSVIRRKKATRPQAGLTNARRRANMQGAFQIAGKKVMRGKPLAGMRVLLVDDVVTTGATASACARVLKRAGAAHVALLALARTDRRQAVELSFTAGGHA